MQNEIIKMKIMGCFLEYNGKFLILLRKEGKSEGGTWGLPAGKVLDGEAENKAMLRELKEETGYEAQKEELQFVKTWSWNFEGKKVEFWLYKIALVHNIPIRLSRREHTTFRWVTVEEALSLPNPIHGLREILEEKKKKMWA